MEPKAFGIDISEWQGDFDFSGHQIDFVIIRAGDGSYWDKYLRTNIDKAVKAGLPYGLYWFIRDHTGAAAKKTAENLLTYIKGLPVTPSVGIWADIEDNGEWCQPEHAQEPAWAFCDAIEKGGYYTGIYCNWYFYNGLFPYCRRFDCWIADWSGVLTDPPGMLQQYSTSNGRLDLDCAFCDLSVFALDKKPDQVKPSIPDEDVKEIVRDLLEASRDLYRKIKKLYGDLKLS